MLAGDSKKGHVRPIGWYGLLGHSVYRDESLIRLETASSINTTSL